MIDLTMGWKVRLEMANEMPTTSASSPKLRTTLVVIPMTSPFVLSKGPPLLSTTVSLPLALITCWLVTMKPRSSMITPVPDETLWYSRPWSSFFGADSLTIVTTDGMAKAAAEAASAPEGAADATLMDEPSSLDDFDATRPAIAPATAPPSSATTRKATSQAREGP